MASADVLHVITHLPVGGAQDNTLLSVAGLRARGYRVDLASAPGGAWEARGRAAADRFWPLPTMRRELTPADDVRTIQALARLLRRERYSIVHTHSSKAGLLGRVAARLARTPHVVHTVHGFAFNDLTFSPTRRRLYLWLERFGALLSDRLVFVAELNRQEALRRGVGREAQMRVIVSGIDLSRFTGLPAAAEARARLDIPSHHAVVGSVGRLAACNAPLLLVDAAQRLLAQRPDTTVLIVGDDPKWRPRVAAAIGGEPRIRLLGYRDDVPQILAALDVFLSTNMWAGLGRALTEAMAVGVPVVAFPVNGVPELVIDGETGLHAAVGDAADAARQTVRLLEDRELARRLGRAAAAHVRRSWSAARMVDDLDALYRGLLAPARRREEV